MLMFSAWLLLVSSVSSDENMFPWLSEALGSETTNNKTVSIRFLMRHELKPFEYAYPHTFLLLVLLLLLLLLLLLGRVVP